MKSNRGSIAILLTLVLVIVVVGIGLWMVMFRKPKLSETDLTNLHSTCETDNECGKGQKCIQYQGFAGLIKTCEISCPGGDVNCPNGFVCQDVIHDGPSNTCWESPTS